MSETNIPVDVFMQELRTAATSGDLDRITDLLDHQMHLVDEVEGAVNPQDRCLVLLTPALNDAISSEQVDAVRLLLDRGAHVNAGSTQPDCDTPLCMAAYLTKNTDMLELLMQRGANLDARGDQERTALHYAVLNAHLPSVQCLVTHGANVYLKNDESDNALEVALDLDKENEEVFGCERNLQDILIFLRETMFAINDFFEASKEENVERMSELLDAGLFPVDTPVDEIGNTALHHASQEGRLSTMKALLQRGASIERPNLVGSTALHCAACGGKNNAAQLLLDHENANANIVNANSGETPLHLAANFGHVELMELLIQNGADLDMHTQLDMTPLVYAVVMAKLQAVQCLVSHGANVFAKGLADRTANDWAEYKRKTATTRSNYEALLEIESCLGDAMRNGAPSYDE